MTTRQAGTLAALDALAGGDHVGWIVDEITDFARLAALSLQQGASAGQKLFFFSPRHGGQLSPLPIGKGVSVLDPHVAFLRGGALDASVMYASFRQETSKAIAEGYQGLRVIADMDWLMGPRPSGDQLVAFEQGLDAVAAETGATIVCAYRRDSFPHRDLAGVMCVHPQQLGASPRDLGFQIWSSGEGRWHVSGQIDLRAAEAFPAALRTAAAGRASLWLDCTQLGFIDVAGIRALVQMARGAGISVQLHGANDTLRRCWKLLDWESAAPSVEFSA